MKNHSKQNNSTPKTLFIGSLFTILILSLIGIGFAKYSVGVDTINVPQGKTAMYFIIDNSDAVELRDALCHNYKYKVNLLDENGTIYTNPESCNTYANNQVKRYLRENLLSYRKYQYELNYDSGDNISIE